MSLVSQLLMWKLVQGFIIPRVIYILHSQILWDIQIKQYMLEIIAKL